MATRRGEGSISPYKYGYAGQVTIETTSGRKRKTVYGKTVAEVQAKILELRSAAAQGPYSEPSKLTVGELLTKWLEAVEGTVRPTTLESYRYLARDHVTPLIGELALKSLNPMHVETYLRQMKDAGRSARMRQMALAVLRLALKKAVYPWGLLQVDPSAGIKKPQSETKKQHTTWTEDDARKVLDVAGKFWIYPFLRLALSTGMRHGELLGLRWCDVDMKAGQISVTNTLVELPGELPCLGPVKTKSGARLIYLTPEAKAALTMQRARMLKNGVASSEWVFPSTRGASKGGPTRKRTIYKAYGAIIKAAGVPPIRVHDLRHTVATLLLSRDEHPKVVQELLGHSQIAVTLDTYSHVTPSMREGAAKSLEEILG